MSRRQVVVDLGALGRLVVDVEYWAEDFEVTATAAAVRADVLGHLDNIVRETVIRTGRLDAR